MKLSFAQIKTLPVISLKPNKYFSKVDYPFLYQKRGILMMIARPNMVLGDDVGLGKTLEAIVHYSYIKSAKPELKALVLTERSALKQWQKEIDFLTTGLRSKIVTAESFPDKVLRIKTLVNLEVDILISTYSLVYKHWTYMAQGLGGVGFALYADEPNYFKNSDTALYKEMRELANHAGHKFGLTATLVENRLEEAYGVLKIMAPDYMPGRIEFEREYCVKKKIPRVRAKIIVGYKNLSKFRAMIEPVYFGRLQTDPEVQQELPDVIPKDQEITLTKKQSLKVIEAMDRLIEMPDGQVKGLLILPALTLAQQLVNDPMLAKFDIPGEKIPALIETLTNSMAGQRVVIYSKFRSQIDRLEASLKAVGIESVRITGAESEAQREVSKTRFMSDGMDHCRIILINKAGSRAIDLQKAGCLIFFDMPWSYGIFRQVIGRLKRTGSSFRKIVVIRFLAVLHPDVVHLVGTDKTIDHYVLQTIMRKKEIFDVITGDTETLETVDSDLVDIYREIKKAYRGV